MSDTVTLTSTTDTLEQVRAALGIEPEEAEGADVDTAGDAQSASDDSEVHTEVVSATATGEGKAGKSSTPTEAASDESTDDPDDTGEASSASEAGQTLARRRNTLQERIDKLTRDKHTSKRERDAAVEERDRLKAELDALKAAKPPPEPATPTEPKAESKAEPPKEPQAPTTKPKLEDFPEEDYDSYDLRIAAYTEAVADWKAERAVGALRAEWAAERQKAEQEAATKVAQAALNERVAKAKEKFPDYDEVLGQAQNVMVSQVILETLRDIDEGLELTYYLAKNPSEVERLNGIVASVTAGPHVAVYEIGRLKAQLDSGLKQETTPPVATARVPVSKAPAPLTRVGAGPTTTTKDPETMTQREYNAWRDSMQRQSA
jgi:hypothetical protein